MLPPRVPKLKLDRVEDRESFMKSLGTKMTKLMGSLSGRSQDPRPDQYSPRFVNSDHSDKQHSEEFNIVEEQKSHISQINKFVTAKPKNKNSTERALHPSSALLAEISHNWKEFQKVLDNVYDRKNFGDLSREEQEHIVEVFLSKHLQAIE